MLAAKSVVNTSVGGFLDAQGMAALKRKEAAEKAEGKRLAMLRQASDEGNAAAKMELQRHYAKLKAARAAKKKADKQKAKDDEVFRKKTVARHESRALFSIITPCFSRP